MGHKLLHSRLHCLALLTAEEKTVIVELTC